MGHFSQAKFLKLAKGYYSKGKNCISVVIPRVDRALRFAYIERRLKKRNMKKSWILSINAAVREHGLPYSRFIYGLNHSNIELDRKILSNLAQTEPLSFKAVVDEVKVQTNLGQEAKPLNIGAFDNAMKEGIILMPGQPLPDIEEVYKNAKGKELNWRRGFEPIFNKPPLPSKAKINELREAGMWESDEEKDLFEIPPDRMKPEREKMKGEPEDKGVTKPNLRHIYDPKVKVEKLPYKTGTTNRNRHLRDKLTE